MYICPHCESAITLEIQQFGGECSNCFRFIEGNINEQEEFEPTGMFTKEQFSSILTDEASSSSNVEITEDVALEEIELEEVNYEDEITEILEPTDPMVDEAEDTPVTQEKPIVAEEVDEIDDFDFDDEPTVALASEDVIAQDSTGDLVSEEVELMVAEPFESSELQEPAISVIQSGVESTEEQSPPQEDLDDYVFDEDSDESFLNDSSPESEGDSSHEPLSYGSVATISPKHERDSKKRATTSKSKRPIVPILIGMVLVAVVIAAILPKEEPQTVQDSEVTNPSIYVPEVSKSTVEKTTEVPTESVQTKQKTKTNRKSTESKVVNKGGVETFRTAAPVLRTPTPKSVGKTANGSVKNDLGRLQKSLQYCHTVALKTNPTSSGKWQVKFKVNGDGQASGVSIKALRQADSDLESCMKRRISRFKFYKAGTTTPVDFRVVFGR